MLRHRQRSAALFLLISAVAAVKAYYVEIKSSGSTVIGGSINFTAILYDDNAVANTGSYMFKWEDNMQPPHHAEFNSKEPYSNWTIQYPLNTTAPGSYRATLKVEKDYVIWITVATNHLDFELSENLSGEMQLLQGKVQRKHDFVSTTVPVNHTIELRPSDAVLVAENATSVQSYWFQNCTFLGIINGLRYEAQYKQPNEFYKIEALVVVSFDPLPEPTTTTTTTTTTTSTTTTTTTPKTTTSTSTTTTTTPKPALTTTIPAPTNTTQNADGQRRRRRDAAAAAAAESTLHTAPANGALLDTATSSSNVSTANVHASSNGTETSVAVPQDVSKLRLTPDLPFDCASKNIVARDSNKLYGYFEHHIISKSPVSNFSTNGKDWLPHGDMLHLQLKCKGSPPLEMCISVFNAPYNATGNESCRYYFPLDSCEYNYTRFFYESKTMLFFIRNDVSDIMNQVTVNIYEAKVQSQLSVVVVPVSFTLVAVILVVFGISYYIQSRNRFTVEVADFNFGETQSVDMEYKTFQQRLIDSIRDVLPQQRRYSEFSADIEPEPGEQSPGGSVNGTGQSSTGPANSTVDSNIRYNSMT